MPTQLTLYNGALRIIKNRKLSALTDTVEARYLLDDEYEKVKKYCIEQGLWNFALRTVALEPDTGNTPEFGYQNAFETPSDFVRLNAIAANANMYPTLEDYAIEGSYYLANLSTLYMSYVSNGVNYGYDLSKWPATFELYVEHELASRIVGHLTNASAADIETLEASKKKALKDARSKDALNQAAIRPPPGKLVQSRTGMRGSSNGQSPWWRS